MSHYKKSFKDNPIFKNIVSIKLNISFNLITMTIQLLKQAAT